MASDADIAKHLRDILQSDEFAESINDKFVQQIIAWFKALEAWTQGLGFLTRWVIVGVCLILLAAIAAHVIYSITQANLPTHRTGLPRRGASDAQVTAAMLLERAEILAEAGNLRDAASALQQAVLVHMCRERDVAWRASRADWEWVDILGPPARVVAFIHSAQRLAFGPTPARAGYDNCLREAEALLRVDTRSMGEAAS